MFLSNAHHGFTLTELLVVIAILASLAGLLVPHLAKAHQSALDANCISNQKQIYNAIQMYAQTYNTSYPISQYYKGRVQYNWDTITENGVARPGLIWRFQNRYEIQQCPVFTGKSNTAADIWTGYNYNTTYIGRGFGERKFKGMTQAPATLGQLNDPTNTALIGDGGYKSGANKFMRAPYDKAGDYLTHSGSQAFRHSNKSTIVFWADGHASTHNTPYKKSKASDRMRILQDFPNNGFLGDSDDMYDRE